MSIGGPHEVLPSHGLVRCPHTAARSRFARCAHSKYPTRSVAEYTRRPSARCIGPATSSRQEERM